MKKLRNKKHQVKKSKQKHVKHQPNKQSANSSSCVVFTPEKTLASALNHPRREQFWDVIEAIDESQAREIALFQGMKKELAGIKKMVRGKTRPPLPISSCYSL